MDENNVRSAKRIFGGDSANKIVKLLSCLGSDGDIADPWYTGNFSLTYSQIESGCNALLESIKKLKNRAIGRLSHSFDIVSSMKMFEQ